MIEKRGRTCPKCGSSEIWKEYMLGSDTGDLKCAKCGFTAWRNDEDWYKKSPPDLKEPAPPTASQPTDERQD